MRHNIIGRSLNRDSGHRKALYRNLVTALLKHEKIVTTEAKAKEIRPMAEKMITLGKQSGLSSYRQALTFITDKKVTEKIFSELGPRYKERSGGYTRIVKLEPRLGDAAPMVQLELVK
ncbi:MAG: 50S ribosomal protein L17 [Chloroflexi bacterium RBG_13_52_12]|nr:MAG: 50S ribosomal protein L17 [Chloroflexi bacterium RBG_13_52_12]